ncbi:PspC domain-containing protein [Paenibacillus beijingensis]|uniref:Phage-shock protein n=1 Tax=Paenibacillus beijingensis TaxID=1126833 RepID=A0A0D5NIX3_9BACL|nr:PspC domain-containing protein [Paenibacillus beijingensis]AJY75206.1 phage-shock protein [Paenibacillus beijingensis]
MKPLYRSTRNSRLTGLCGGIGEWLGISPTIVRAALVITAICSFGSALLIYAASSIIVPKAPYDEVIFPHSHTHY